MASDVRLRPSLIDRMMLRVAPSWALNRIRARAAVGTILRHYEAASAGRRTSGWTKSVGDANAVNGPAISSLRANARDLVRNNAWARRALKVISNNTVGWGIMPKAAGDAGERWEAAWKAWAESTQCDADRRLTFAGIQALVLRTVAEAGEVLIRRRTRRAEDGLAIPLQLQILEPDFIDTSKDLMQGLAGGPIVQGIEHDMLGRRVAYWLFEEHPGGARSRSFASKRVPADQIIHVYYQDRPGQVRGVSWFAPVILTLKDFDEYEDASLMLQKVASCMVGFVTDPDGERVPLGETKDPAGAPLVDTLEPGLVSYLKPGQEVTFSSPPTPVDGGFGARTLRRVGAGLGITYEDLAGDYSQVNFSAGRMGRQSHWANVDDWRWNMLVPQFCDGAWAWAMEAAVYAGIVKEPLPAIWTPPARQAIDPDKEGLAIQRLVRSGAMTPDEMVREQGKDPETHWQEYADNLKQLDELGIVLDSDPRKVSQAGLTQERVGGGGGGKGGSSGEDA